MFSMPNATAINVQNTERSDNPISHTGGIVNYTAFKLSNRDFITLRFLDFIFDGRGQRSGFETTLGSWTVGWTHRFFDLILSSDQRLLSRQTADIKH